MPRCEVAIVADRGGGLPDVKKRNLLESPKSAIASGHDPEFEPIGGTQAAYTVFGSMVVFVAAVTLAIGYHDVLGSGRTWLWLVGLAVTLAAFLGLRRVSPAPEKWLWQAALLGLINLIAALFGGAAAWVVWHTDPSTQLLLWPLLYAVCALGVATIAYRRLLYLSFPILVMMPALVAVTARGQLHATEMLAVSHLFLAVLAVFAWGQRGLFSSKANNLKRLREVFVSHGLLQAKIDRSRETETRIRESEQRHRSLLENVPDLLYRIDLDGTIVQVSPSCQEILGYRPDELVGRNFAELLPDDNAMNDLCEALQERDGILTFYRHRIARKDGKIIWLSANATLIQDVGGSLARIEGSSRDVTEAVLTEQAFNIMQRRAEATLAAIADGIVTTDKRGIVDYLNPVAEGLTGWSCSRGRGERLSRILRLEERRSGRVAADLVQRCLREAQTVVLSGDLVAVHCTNQRQTGVQVTASPILDDQGECRGVVAILHDVSRVHDMARELSYQAAHDRLTGLINRAEFEVRVQDALRSAVEDNAHHALLYMDLDQFKVVNDTGGHVAGDALLTQLAGRLMTVVRESDVLARLGGDEFGVLLEGCSLRNAERVAENLRAAVSSFRFHWDDKVFDLGISIGLVPIGAGCGDLTDLLAAADAACYVAKDQGRDRIHVSHVSDSQSSTRQDQASWVRRIQSGYQDGRFELFIQPIISITTPSGYTAGEFLLRLQHDDGDLACPSAFLPAAERYHLMPRVDRWVVAQAMRLITLGPAGLMAIDEFSVNLSGQSLSDDAFLEFVVKQLDQSDIPPTRLCFEITEAAVVTHLHRASRFISVLRELGCKFSLDDFGSLSSFQYLRELQVDKLKIDGTFVRDIAQDKVNRAMVRAIAQVGKQMDILTIAEYVESEDALVCLRELGVDYAQGFHMGRPRQVLTAP